MTIKIVAIKNVKTGTICKDTKGHKVYVYLEDGKLYGWDADKKKWIRDSELKVVVDNSRINKNEV